MSIINLTQYPTTVEMKKLGIVDLKESAYKTLLRHLVFMECPDKARIKEAAKNIAALAYTASVMYHTNKALIGGDPFLMPSLEKALRKLGIQPVYLFDNKLIYM